MHIKFLPSVDFRYLPQVFRRLASTNADTETFCIVLLTSQVVMVKSLQPKGLEFESTCVIFYGDLVYKFKRIVGKPYFSDQSKRL